MTETQETKEIKFDVPDHTTSCKSVKCSCNYEDLPKSCNIRLYINELEIKVLQGKILELQCDSLINEARDTYQNQFNKKVSELTQGQSPQKIVKKTPPKKKSPPQSTSRKKTKNVSDDDEDDD